MEMMVLSILSPVLMCEWKLSSYKEAMITTVSLLYIYYFIQIDHHISCYSKCSQENNIPLIVWYLSSYI